jgi:hypothetical protein
MVHTVIDTTIHCALDMSPNLRGKEVKIPNDWQNDHWEPTRDSMCERFSPLKEHCSPAWIDSDAGDTEVAEETIGFSRAARRAIARHSLG